jgi:hypothetical protein
MEVRLANRALGAVSFTLLFSACCRNDTYRLMAVAISWLHLHILTMKSG